MLERAQFGLGVLAALGCGLVAGTFFAFSSFVMGALGKLPPAQGITAMQSINVVVINPWFMSAFIGTAALSLATSVTALVRWQEPGAACLLGGSMLYFAGTFLVTMLFNVPRNNALAAVVPTTTDAARLWTFAEAVAEISRATGRSIRYAQVSPEAYATALRDAQLPEPMVALITYLFAEVLDGRNASVADGVTRALGRRPRDFTEYARDAAASGVWNPASWARTA